MKFQKKMVTGFCIALALSMTITDIIVASGTDSVVVSEIWDTESIEVTESADDTQVVEMEESAVGTEVVAEDIEKVGESEATEIVGGTEIPEETEIAGEDFAITAEKEDIVEEGRLLEELVKPETETQLEIGEGSKRAEYSSVIIDSGEWGDNCTYTLDSDGVLTISGNGTVDGFEFPYESSVKRLVISDGVERIGNCEFFDYNNLENVELSRTVTSVGENAFSNCGSLKEVDMPSVASIEDSAFSNCSSLKEVDMPSVTSIGYKAFGECSKVTNISVPLAEEIGANAFENCCELECIELSGKLESGVFRGCGKIRRIICWGNVEYEYDTFLWGGYGSSEYNDFCDEGVVENYGTITVTSNNCMLDKNGLLTIFGEKGSVPSILARLVLDIVSNESETEVREYRECVNLQSVKMLNATSIGIRAFENCSSLKKIEMPLATSVGGGAFENCSSLETVEMPLVTSIGNGAFENCSSLKNIKIPKTVTEIDQNVFSGCDSLEDINVDEGNPNYCSVEGVLYNKEKTELYRCPQKADSCNIPNGVTDIAYFAFGGCQKLAEITIPESVTSIGIDAFYDCRSMTGATILSNDSLWDSGFGFCRNQEVLRSKVDNFTIYGYEYCKNEYGAFQESEVYKYAIKNQFKFVALDIPKVSYTVKFNGNGSTGGKMKDQTISYGSGTKLSANAFKRKGYSFNGWNTKADGSGTSIADKADGSTLAKTDAAIVTLYAQWKKAKYTITYDLGGGINSEDNPSTYTITTKTITLASPTRKGYTFKGWYLDKDYKNQTKEIKKGSTGNVTLYAKWTPNKYAVYFNGNGNTSGSMDALTGCKYGKKYTLTANAYKRKGYSFNGWNTKADGGGTSYKNKAEIKNLSSKSGGKVTLYAQWKKTKYTITYKLNDGKNNKNNPVSYTITSKTIKLKNPTRKGYTFAGWYSDKKCTKKITQIKKGSTGNKTLYAKWKVNKYTISFNGNGSTAGNMDSLKSCKYGKKYTLTTNTYKRKGYTFEGWNTKADGSGTLYKNGAQVKNLSSKSGGKVTLYAQWKKK